MQFILKAFCELNGLGAASGLVYQHPQLYLISDYSSYLYRYDMPQAQLDKIALFADSRDFLPKPEKFDFETLLYYDNALLMLGSGSTPQRNTLLRFQLDDLQIDDLQAEQISHSQAHQYDLSALYQKFKQIAQLTDDAPNNSALNIEGAIYHQEQWLFFQRGNGAQSQNGIFVVQGNILEHNRLHDNLRDTNLLNANLPIEYVPVQLPVINKVASSFTDAILVGQTIYFLATAENSSSTYEDGEVLGSYIGRMDLHGKMIQDIQLITTCHKFEGLTLYQQTPQKLEFLLCEDNDTEQFNSTIYKLSLSLQ